MKILFLFVLAVALLSAEASIAPDLFTTAVTTGDLATVETILSSGLDPNLPDRRGQTPLCLALLAGRTGVMQLLLARHADPNAPLNNAPFPATPLQYAVEYGNVRAASILIAAGAHVNAERHGTQTPLHLAVLGRRLDMLQLLIEKGADLNARDREGASPLDHAAWHGSLDVAAILLAHGARLDEPESQTGATPINEAAWAGNTAIVEYFLRFHPDLGIPDKRGYTPLENATRMGKEDSALLLLEAEPAEAQTPQFFEKTMDSAIAKNEYHVVEALLRHGAAINKPLLSGATPLEAGASAGAEGVVRVLLENHADPNLEGRNGTSALEEASLRGFDAIVGLLLDHGALINRLNAGSATTALYAAAAFGKDSVTQLLLHRGADPALCGPNHKTPWLAARESGFTELAAHIQQHGGATACARQVRE